MGVVPRPRQAGAPGRSEANRCAFFGMDLAMFIVVVGGNTREKWMKLDFYREEQWPEEESKVMQ